MALCELEVRDAARRLVAIRGGGEQPPSSSSSVLPIEWVVVPNNASMLCPVVNASTRPAAAHRHALVTFATSGRYLGLGRKILGILSNDSRTTTAPGFVLRPGTS
mmetsp:Transcript_19976/g.64351  ORF Transcript_19976/g.64351 Transcript_19976/m.64351 type:complete len:105 (-) Transcript_19976:578-892(-)